MERRNGDRRMIVLPGGRGKGPGQVCVLRAQLVEHHMEDLASWSEVGEAARRIAQYAEGRQRRAFQRVGSWDGPKDAA